MVHVPKILNESTKFVKNKAKGAALAGVAIVQAHPVAAAVTIVAIVGVGLAIYYFKNSSKSVEKDLTYSSHRTKGHCENVNSYFYNQETKSITNAIPSSNDSNGKKASRKKEKTIHFPPDRNLVTNDTTASESRNVIKLGKKLNESSASNSLKSNDKSGGECLSVQKLNVNCVNLPAASNFSESTNEVAGKYSTEKLNGNFVNLQQGSVFQESDKQLADKSYSVQKLDENYFDLQAASNFLDSNDETICEFHNVENLEESCNHLSSASNSLKNNDKPAGECHSVHKLNENCVNLPAASNFSGNYETTGQEPSVENLDQNFINLPPASYSVGINVEPVGESRSLQKLDENCMTLLPDSNLPGNNVATGKSHSTENLNESFINLPSESNSYKYWTEVSFSDSTNFQCETSMGTLRSNKSVWCKTCGENPVNTHMEPCNHRYMCGDCARKFFKCEVCHAKIKEVIIEKS